MSLDVYIACQCCGSGLIDWNVTHNLATMARHAGCYDALWRAPENDITAAGQLIDPLRSALVTLREDPDRFKAYNPANGWGDYDGFVDAVFRLLAVCESHPGASVRTSR
jgi:hypothetical protein